MSARFAEYGPIGHRESFFPPEEHERRLNRVRGYPDEAGLDVLITFSPTNIAYLSGHSSLNLWDYQCLIVPESGEPVMVLWYFELGRFHASSTGTLAEPYGTGEDAIRLTLDVLRRYGWISKRIGVDGGSASVSPRVVNSLLDGLAGHKVKLVLGIIEQARVVKSSLEVERLRQAAQLTGIGIQAAVQAVASGATDLAVAAAANHAILKAGSHFMATTPIVAAGWRSGTPHSTASGHVLEPGDVVFLEIGANVARYTTPVMRTATVGPPSPHVRQLADVATETLETLISSMRPGALASEVAQAGDRVIAKIASEIIFHYTYGYSVWVSFPPAWIEDSNFLIVRDNHRPLLEGMVFHLPISLRVYGKYGIGISQTVHICKEGVEVLTSHIPRDLFVR